jgi:hypothetical protein
VYHRVVASSANPLRRAFWLGTFDARRLARFRVGLALVAMLHLWELPTIDLASGWPMRVLLLLVAYGVFGALLVGHRTRSTTLLAACVWLVMAGRTPVLLSWSERLVRLLLFPTVFCDLGAAFSLDVRRGARAAQSHVPAVAPRALQVQLLVVMLVAAASRGWSGLATAVVLGALLWAPGGPGDRTSPEAASAPPLAPRPAPVALGLALILQLGLFGWGLAAAHGFVPRSVPVDVELSLVGLTPPPG